MNEPTVWDLSYDMSRKPSWEEISSFIRNPLWEEINGYIAGTYGAKPEVTYSKCAAQRGWNVKYKTRGRALCTLYPEEGSFIALVVVGSREEAEVETAFPGFTDYVRGLYEAARSMPMGRWLMIRVTDRDILRDVKLLTGIRVKPKGR